MHREWKLIFNSLMELDVKKKNMAESKSELFIGGGVMG